MSRRVAAVFLVAVVLALTPIAHACQTDPTWIGGFYDDNDYDDVVLLITAGVSAVEARVVAPIGPVTVCLGVIDPGRPHTLPVRSVQSLTTRAPPDPLA
ncbi:MAG TPA: hypothetical protein VHT71_10475 [Methylomirabilota bacterium]|jgi:hypothetical protein|nr:hypothetical protein [Methylomirabilota bacterium]